MHLYLLALDKDMSLIVLEHTTYHKTTQPPHDAQPCKEEGLISHCDASLPSALDC